MCQLVIIICKVFFTTKQTMNKISENFHIVKKCLESEALFLCLLTIRFIEISGCLIFIYNLPFQVGTFLQPYVNSLSSVVGWLPVLSGPLAGGEGLYPGEQWCKVNFKICIM